MLKILFIREHNPFYENSASANRYSGLIKGLALQGVMVTMIITGGYCNIKEYLTKKNTHYNQNIEVIYLISTFDNNIWLSRINTYILKGVYKFVIKAKINKYIKSNFDIIWITYNRTVLEIYNDNYKNIKGKSFIELNEYNDLHEGEKTPSNKVQNRNICKENAVFLEAIKNIDLFGIMTNNLIKHYSQLIKTSSKILHLPMTVDVSRFNNSFYDDSRFQKPYIAYTGSFDNQKDGVDILIRSFLKIAHKYPDYKLYIVGFYHKDYSVNKKLIENSIYSKRIKTIKKMPQHLIPGFLKNATLLVMARPDSKQAKGGFPTKLGEYLATGNPVCATRVGEVEDYLQDNESIFFAKPGDVNSFADAMDKALKDLDNAKKIGNNGKIVALNNFCKDIQSNRLHKFLVDNTSDLQ